MSEIFATKARRIARPTTIEGELFMVGGVTAEYIPVAIRDAEGTVYRCGIAGVDKARWIARYLFRQVRVAGLGEWECGPRGDWTMQVLVIEAVKRI